MARMPDQWEIERDYTRKKEEVARTSREEMKFILKYANATDKDLLKLIFSLQKRLEILQNKVDSISSRSQML